MVKGQPLRYYKPDSIGLLYLNMLTFMPRVVINVSGLRTYLKDMRCYCKLSYK